MKKIFGMLKFSENILDTTQWIYFKNQKFSLGFN